MEPDNEKIREAVTESFRIFLRNKLRTENENSIGNKMPILYTVNNCDKNPLEKERGKAGVCSSV